MGDESTVGAEGGAAAGCAAATEGAFPMANKAKNCYENDVENKNCTMILKTVLILV